MIALIIVILWIFSSRDPQALIAAALFHEAGHVLAALLLAGELPRVSFTIAGVRLSYIGLWSASSQIAVSAAGPIVSILIGLIFYEKESLALFSLALGAVNLLPVSCLDGGGILRAAMDNFCLPQRSFLICRIVSVVSTILIFALNCAVQLKVGANVSLAVLSVYLVYYSFAGW